MTYKEIEPEDFSRITLDSWNSFKDRVFVRLINQKTVDSEPEYEEAIKVPYMDLYKLFYVREIDRADDVVKGYTLKKEDMKKYNMKFSKLNKQANENLSNDVKMRIKTYTDDLIGELKLAPVLRIPHEFRRMITHDKNIPASIEEPEDINEPQNVLVISNSHDVFGSSYMASSNVIKYIYEKFNKDNFYMIHVACHSFFAIRQGYLSDNNKISRSEYEDSLFNMIEDFNYEVKDWKDILSYRLYYYAGNEGGLILSIKNPD